MGEGEGVLVGGVPVTVGARVRVAVGRGVPPAGGVVLAYAAGMGVVEPTTVGVTLGLPASL